MHQRQHCNGHTHATFDQTSEDAGSARSPTCGLTNTPAGPLMLNSCHTGGAEKMASSASTAAATWGWTAKQGAEVEEEQHSGGARGGSGGDSFCVYYKLLPAGWLHPTLLQAAALQHLGAPAGPHRRPGCPGHPACSWAAALPARSTRERG